MDLYDENFKIQDMIDSDMRSLRSELGEYFTSDISCSPGSSQLEALTPAMPMDVLDSTLDSELSNDGRTGWMNSSQLFNMSADFDSIGGLLVNPQTALPVSLSDSLILSTSRTVATSDAAVTLVAEKTQDAQTHISTSGGSITVTLPVQVITTTALVSSDVNERTSQVNLTVAVPTPSPSPHNLTQQQFSSQDSEISPDICDSPKPKSKNKTVKPSQHIKLENAYPKPAYSYSCLIAMALKNSKTGSLPVNEIYDFMTENFPYFKTAPNGWKNSVRHNLSLNKCFEKIEKPTGNSAQRKGYLWAMNPAKVEKMEEELQKWGSKDPVAIRKSMANPERLELIEKGELKHDLIGDMKDTLQVASETKLFKSEKGGHFKIISVGNLNSDLINSDFPSMGETVNIDPCLPELDLQKGIWENLCEDRLQFLSDSPANPLSPETMDDDSSLDSVPSNQQSAPRSFIRANYIYKRASDTSNNKRPLLTHSSIKQEQSAMCDA